MTDIIVIGARPAGERAALCAAELGAHTALVAGGEALSHWPILSLAHTATA